MSLKRLKTGPSRRGKGEVFPGPATFGGPATAQNYRQRWLLSDIKYPWNPFFCGRAPFRTPLRKIVTLPRRLVGWCRDTPPKFPSSRCLRRLDLGAYGMRLWIGPCENGFPGPAAAAVDGPGWRMEIQRTLLLTAYLVIDEVSNGSKVYDLEWPKQYFRFFLRQIFVKLNLPDVSVAMSTAATSIKWNKQLPAHSVSIEIYSTIARFTCDNADFLLSKSVLSRLKSIVFSSRVKSHFIQVVNLTRFWVEVGSDCNGTGDSQV